MEAVIQNKADTLYTVNPVYFPSADAANQTVREGAVEGIAFLSMADHEGKRELKGGESDWPNEETRQWNHIYKRRVNSHAHPIHEVWRLAWNDWYT